jgi:FkbM family methyltransferase
MLGKLLVYVDGRDISVAPHLAASGYWEIWIAQAVARYVKPGMRCIDVGANFGFYTLLLAELVGDKGFVQAWEPNDATRHCLHASVMLNGFEERVSVLMDAASDQECTRRMWLPDKKWGDAQLVADDDREANASVLTSPLDKRFEGDVDFMKIDAEGHEPEVWRGARRLLTSNPDTVVVLEFAPDRYADPKGFLGRIQGDGYQLSRVGSDGSIEPCTPQAALEAPGGYEMLWLARG